MLWRACIYLAAETKTRSLTFKIPDELIESKNVKCSLPFLFPVDRYLLAAKVKNISTKILCLSNPACIACTWCT